MKTYKKLLNRELLDHFTSKREKGHLVIINNYYSSMMIFNIFVFLNQLFLKLYIFRIFESIIISIKSLNIRIIN